MSDKVIDGYQRDAALRYHDAGWPPLDLPERQKAPPPEGRTGYEGVDMTRDEIAALDWTGKNIGLRMPPDVIGLDIDAYRGGNETLQALLDQLGELPLTWITHSGRNDGSGIRFFLVPPALSWVHSLPGIEIVQRHHRCAVVWPSVHPDGRQYRWFNQSDEFAAVEGDIPRVDDLPELPWPWITHLSRTTNDEVRSHAVDFEGRVQFFEVMTNAEALSYLSVIEKRFRDRVDAGAARHDTMQHCLTWACECARARLFEASTLYERLGALWQTALVDEPKRSVLVAERPTEFEAMLRHAIGKAMTKPDAFIAKLHDEHAGMRIVSSSSNGSTATGELIAADQNSRRRLTLRSVEGIGIRRVRWLWDQRVPSGALTLLGGREGIGKSVLALELAARVTRGELKGEFHGQPRAVVIAATEDSWAHTIVPRLTVAGADLARTHRVDVTEADGQRGALNVPHDVPALADSVAEIEAVLVLLDPIISRLDASLDTYRDAEVRRGLEPLADAADGGDFSVLGLIHVNKGTTNDPLTMLMASRAFAAVARAVLFTTLDLEQPGMRLIGQPKNNLGRTDLDTLLFDIVEKFAGIDSTDGTRVTAGALQWCGVSQRTILDAIHDAARSPAVRVSVKEAEDWLSDYLKANRVADSKEVKAAAAAEGHAERTLHRAREKIGAGVTRIGFPRRTVWSDPELTPDEVEKLVASRAKPSADRDDGSTSPQVTSSRATLSRGE